MLQAANALWTVPMALSPPFCSDSICRAVALAFKHFAKLFCTEIGTEGRTLLKTPVMSFTLTSLLLFGMLLTEGENNGSGKLFKEIGYSARFGCNSVGRCCTRSSPRYDGPLEAASHQEERVTSLFSQFALRET